MLESKAILVSIIDLPGGSSHLSLFWSAFETTFWTLVSILAHTERILSVVVDVSTLRWFYAGRFATFAHGGDGPRTSTIQVQFLNICCPGLIARLSNVRITLTLIVLDTILVLPVVAPVLVLSL
jgi:hypothetical protein